MYNKELEQMLHSDDFSDRVTAAECAYGLDILVNDESPYVREEVARQGYGLNKLIQRINSYHVYSSPSISTSTSPFANRSCEYSNR